MTVAALEKAKEMVIKAAKHAGRRLKDNWGRVEYTTKDNCREIVTELDRETELFLAGEFEKFDNRIGFRGEEFGTQRQARLMWLVDPIDGTVHFVRGLPFCTTMIALIEDKQVILGVIHDFIRDETYWAIRDQGAFKDNRKIQIGQGSFTNGALVSLETNLENPICLEPYLALRKKLELNGMSRLISTANSGFESIMVASGIMDARITFNGYGKDYDYAATSIIIEEAGGIVRNIGADDYDYTKLQFNCRQPPNLQGIDQRRKRYLSHAHVRIKIIVYPTSQKIMTHMLPYFHTLHPAHKRQDTDYFANSVIKKCRLY